EDWKKRMDEFPEMASASGFPGHGRDWSDDSLSYEMWRAVRLVVDTGMHSMAWTRNQAIQFLKDNTGKTDQDITVEVDRYIVWPGQALAYKLGRLKIRELWTEAERKLGAKFDARKFHDAVLENGAIPLGMLETHVKEWIAAQ